MGVTKKLAKDVEGKMNTIDAVEQLREKASKADAEMALRQIDIIHK